MAILVTSLHFTLFNRSTAAPCDLLWLCSLLCFIVTNIYRLFVAFYLNLFNQMKLFIEFPSQTISHNGIDVASQDPTANWFVTFKNHFFMLYCNFIRFFQFEIMPYSCVWFACTSSVHKYNICYCYYHLVSQWDVDIVLKEYCCFESYSKLTECWWLQMPEGVSQTRLLQTHGPASAKLFELYNYRLVPIAGICGSPKVVEWKWCGIKNSLRTSSDKIVLGSDGEGSFRSCT